MLTGATFEKKILELLLLVGTPTLLLAGWIQHVLSCLKASDWVLLAFGVMFPPLGIGHGFGLWS